jgi:hypothetical protein
MSVHVISSGPSAPACFQDALDTHQFVFVHIVRQIFYEPNPNIEIASVYWVVSTLAVEDQYQIVHFVRVEMKDVWGLGRSQLMNRWQITFWCTEMELSLKERLWRKISGRF